MSYIWLKSHVWTRLLRCSRCWTRSTFEPTRRLPYLDLLITAPTDHFLSFFLYFRRPDIITGPTSLLHVFVRICLNQDYLIPILISKLNHVFFHFRWESYCNSQWNTQKVNGIRTASKEHPNHWYFIIFAAPSVCFPQPGRGVEANHGLSR